MSDKAAILAELQAAHDNFRSRIAALPDSKFDETWLGVWNLSQLLAHMSGWYGEMTGSFERVARGERPTPEGVNYADTDAWNAKFALNAKPGRAALTDWDAAYDRYVAAARALDDSQFGIDPEKGRPRIGNRLLQAAGIEHFAEHQGELEDWLARS